MILCQVSMKQGQTCRRVIRQKGFELMVIDLGGVGGNQQSLSIQILLDLSAEFIPPSRGIPSLEWKSCDLQSNKGSQRIFMWSSCVQKDERKSE
jgi:hypothetical protein